jgi:hypothetical protein
MSNLLNSMSRPKLVVLCMLWLIVLFNISCQEKRKLQLANSEQFNAFYDRFNSDTTFQRERIRLTIGGNAIFDIPNLDTSKFRVERWEFESKFTEKVTSRIDTTFFIKYSFALIDGQWYLVEYVDSYFD